MLSKSHLRTALAPRTFHLGRTALSLAIPFFALALTGRGLAENPWTDSTVNWGSSDQGVPSAGWAPWGATTGGTFGGHSSSHHPLPVRPVPAAPAAFAAPIAPPLAAVRSSEIDPVMLKAANIAEHRALPRSTSLCWRYVKEALVAAGGVPSYPQTVYAKDAGRDLVQHYGFVQLPVRNAEYAPVGSVLVYGGRGAGHVEMRTVHGFVSDYCCNQPADLPFLGAFTRLSGHHRGTETAQVTVPVGIAPGS